MAVNDFMQAFGHQVEGEARDEMRAAYPVVEHPLVRTHPETGAKLLRAPIPLPAESPEAVVAAVAKHIDSSVRVVTFPHIAAEAARQGGIASQLARKIRKQDKRVPVGPNEWGRA